MLKSKVLALVAGLLSGVAFAIVAAIAGVLLAEPAIKLYERVNNANRRGIITCVDTQGNVVKLPFLGMSIGDNGVFSFYSPLVDSDIQIKMDCAVVYEEE